MKERKDTTEPDGTALVEIFGDSLLTEQCSTTCFDHSQGKPLLTGHHTDHSLFAWGQDAHVFVYTITPVANTRNCLLLLNMLLLFPKSAYRDQQGFCPAEWLSVYWCVHMDDEIVTWVTVECWVYTVKKWSALKWGCLHIFHKSFSF